MYASTHLISSKPFTQFPDFPMPDSWPDYPHHSQLLSYFERYADHFDLRSHIWFGTEVVRVEPAEGDRWDVTTRSTGGYGPERTSRYAAVVIANGHNWSPKLPRYEGLEEFRGEVMHASSYKDPAQLRGKRVLVVGAGNTGCDIAVEAAQQASRCWHSTRRGYWYAPKYVLGRPADQVNDTLLALRRAAAGAAVALPLDAAADRRRPDPLRPAQARPPGVRDAPDREQPARLLRRPRRDPPGAGHRPVPPVRGGAGRRPARSTPRWSSSPPATCRASSSSTPTVFGDGAGRAGPRCGCNAFAPGHPTLAVAGLVQPDSGVFTLSHWQTVLFARLLRLRGDRPERAAAFAHRVRDRAGERYSGRVKDSSRHWFEVGHADYLRAVQRALHDLEGR